jgi:hypothetical protein
VSLREQFALSRRTIDQRNLFVRLACVIVPAVLVLSFLPYGDKRLLHTGGRFHSWGHLVAFGVVAFVTAGIARSVWGRIFLFLGSLLFGLGIELGEHLVFHNSLEWMDVLVDAAGVVGGTLTAILSMPKAGNDRCSS